MEERLTQEGRRGDRSGGERSRTPEMETAKGKRDRRRGEGRGEFQISLTNQDRTGWQSEILLGLEGEARPSNVKVTAETRPTTETTT